MNCFFGMLHNACRTQTSDIIVGSGVLSAGKQTRSVLCTHCRQPALNLNQQLLESDGQEIHNNRASKRETSEYHH